MSNISTVNGAMYWLISQPHVSLTNSLNKQALQTLLNDATTAQTAILNAVPVPVLTAIEINNYMSGRTAAQQDILKRIPLNLHSKLERNILGTI